MNMLNETLKFLSVGQRSEKTVQTYLETVFKNTKKIQIKKVINQLKNEHLVDDENLANRLASEYTHKGNQFIANLLREKGISEKIISSTLTKLDSEVNRALKEIKKRKRDQWHNSEEMISFIYRFLKGRRYSYQTAHLVITKLAKNKLEKH